MWLTCAGFSIKSVSQYDGWRCFRIIWPCIVIDSLWIKLTDALISNFIIGNNNSTCFGQSFCPSSVLTRIRTELQFRPDPGRTRSPSCINCTSAVVRLRSSWWWAERMPETCRVIITNNKIGTQCICWFYSQGGCFDKNINLKFGTLSDSCNLIPASASSLFLYIVFDVL
jgi:hypothetical protein